MKTSKHTKLAALIAVGLGTLSLNAIAAPIVAGDNNGAFHAAETTPAKGKGKGKGAKGGMSPAKRFEDLATALNLTEDQKTQIKPILTDAMTQMREVRKDTALTPEQKRPKIQEIVTATRAKISPILTEEQRVKLADMKDFMGGPKGKKGAKKGGKRGGKKGAAAAPAN